VRANAERLGLDPDHIGAWGESAGGHLALMLGVSGDVPELEGNIGPYNDISSKVSAVVNFFGESDLPALIGQSGDFDRSKPDSPEAILIGGPLISNPEKAKSASPITYIAPNDPPILTVHGDKDRMVLYDQAVRLDTALRKAGVTSYFVTVKGAGHGEFGVAANDRVKAFFDKYLQGKDVQISTATIENWKLRSGLCTKGSKESGRNNQEDFFVF
jgi:acetyl esterase/lipase